MINLIEEGDSYGQPNPYWEKRLKEERNKTLQEVLDIKIDSSMISGWEGAIASKAIKDFKQIITNLMKK